MEPELDQVVFSRLVAAQAAHDPDRVVMVFENAGFGAERVTAGDFAVGGNQVAATLRRAGLRRGDRVAIMLRNHPEFIYGLVANSKLGLPSVPIDPRSRGPKLGYLLSFAECAGLITADYVLADEAAAEAIRGAGLRVWALSTPEGRAAGLDPSAEWPVLNEALDGPDATEQGEHVDDARAPWLLAYTSGTTGDPKAIEFTHDRLGLYRRTPKYFGYRPDDIPYTGLSLTHGNALVVTMLPAVCGAVSHSVFSRSFTKTRLWDVCIEHGCTTWSNLGGIATGIYSQPSSDHDLAHQVRLVVSAGMPKEIWRAFEQRFGVKVLEWYGTMEGGFAYNPVGVGPVGSFGQPPADLLEMDVVDETARSVAPGVAGELVVRPKGGEARLNYFKNPGASAKKIRGGWLYTGDMVTRDADGWLYFGHRKEEGGLRKLGEFISEGFIRRVLAEDAEVLDVHVYGVPSRTGAAGESTVVAAVVVRDPDGFDAAALFSRCASRLERSHVPDVIQVVDELPRTASEKVQSRFLAAALEDHTACRIYDRQIVTVSS